MFYHNTVKTVYNNILCSDKLVYNGKFHCVGEYINNKQVYL